MNQIIHNIGKITLMGGVLFFCLEAALYFLGIPKDYHPHNTPAQFLSIENSAVGYLNIPSTSIDFIYDRNPRGYFHTGNVVDQVTNSQGFRGPDITATKPPNTYRALFFGDSFTFGEGVYFEDTYPEQFKKMANNQHLFQNKSVESINLGVGGFSTPNEYALLKLLMKQKIGDFDRIIVGYTMTDADASQWTVIPGSNGAKDEFSLNQTPVEALQTDISGKEPIIFKFSRILRIIRESYLANIINQRTIQYYHDIYQNNQANWQKTQQAIADFGNFQKSTGIPVTFVIFPVLYDLQQYPFTNELQEIKDQLQKNNIQYVDLLPVLQKKGYQGSELWVHPTDRHPNELVDKAVAEALVNALSQHDK